MLIANGKHIILTHMMHPTGLLEQVYFAKKGLLSLTVAHPAQIMTNCTGGKTNVLF